jgi:hypothetical protein
MNGGTELSSPGDNPRSPRRWFETIGWMLLIAVLWTVDLFSKISERDQFGFGKDDFRLISEQVTSGIAVVIMIPFVLRWLRMFPLKKSAWAPAVIGHTVGSVLFAFGHHALMVAMRIPWYEFHGLRYVWREPFVNNLLIEYQKDIKIYLGILLVASLYGLYRGSGSLARPQTEDRLIVQTGSGRSVLRFEQIDYLEGARNYVSVHAGDSEYIVRDTMTNLLESLATGPFARTHRSFIVNVDKIVEMRAVNGRNRIFLKNGADVPLSRGYRDEFEAAILGRSK